MKPKISIVIPVYNSEKHLKQCIDSVLNQSYKNIEIILVNDGSTDNCGKICDAYKKADDRVIVIHQKNKGVSVARNTGLDAATGSYIGFVDSDDWVGENMYEELLGLLLKNDLDVTECGVNETGYDIPFTPPVNYSIENSLEALQRIIKDTEFAVWKRLYKKELLHNTKFLPGRTAEDVYFTLDIIVKISKMGCLDFPFYNYRSNPNGITKGLYDFNRFNDAMNATLFLEKRLIPIVYQNSDEKQNIIQEKLFTTFQNFMLTETVHHYKMINYYPHLDPSYCHRRKLKTLIDTYYYKSETHDIFLKMTKLLSVYAYAKFIEINKFRHKIFRTNQF